MIIYECLLELHDNLFFATREMGRFYETGEFIHNYALTYAFGYSGIDRNFPVSPYFCSEQIPSYKEDLSNLSFYITPAKPLEITYDFNTFKFGEANYYLTSTVGPEQGRKLGISSGNQPSFGKIKEISVGSKFTFFIVSENELHLPSWIRLGKWMTKASVEVINKSLSKDGKSGEYSLTHPINPLDIPKENKFINFDIIAMPPSSLINNVTMKGEYIEFETADKKQIKLPANLKYTF
jgi:CRISPR-associated protein Csc1